MSDSSSSSSSAKDLNNLSNESTAVASPSVQVAATPSPPPTAPTTTTTAAPTTPSTTSTGTSSENPIREDMVKSAVSFLSAPNVRSADKAKKIAFLRNKGLNQSEIDEAFKRAGDSGLAASSPPPTTTNTTTTTAAATVSPSVNHTVNRNPSIAPVLPSRNYTQPQIVYYPQPPSPPVPAEKVFAMAVVLGMGAVGLTAGVIGLLRRFIAPIFNRIAEYQRTRYNQRKEIADRLLKSIKSYHTENDDLHALIDQGDEKTVMDALVKHQSELSDKIEQLKNTARDRVSVALKQNTYSDFRSELTNFRNVIVSPSANDSTYAAYSPSHYMRRNQSSSDSPAVSGLKSDIRSLKAVLLNRRNFPTV